MLAAHVITLFVSMMSQRISDPQLPTSEVCIVQVVLRSCKRIHVHRLYIIMLILNARSTGRNDQRTERSENASAKTETCKINETESGKIT